MSQNSSQYGPNQQGYIPADPVSDIALAVVKVVVIAVLVLVALPLVLPALALAFSGGTIATKVRYWATPRWWWIVAVAGVAVCVVVLLVELLELVFWIKHGQAHTFFARPTGVWAGGLWPMFGPWAILNLVLGLLLVPVTFSWQRRKVAAKVQQRRMPDVMIQERIERARSRAADVATARQIGVQIDARTGEIIGVRENAAVTAPHRLRGGAIAFGVVVRPTIRTMQERFYDVRRVRAWIDPTGRYVIMPASASAVRALLLAESGTGKTVLLEDVIACAVSDGWPVLFIDGKGNPADGRALVARARALGASADMAGQWNLFSGTAAQITEKLMRLTGVNTGEGRIYTDELRAVLGAIQGRTPLRSFSDLRARLLDPSAHVRDDYDRRTVEEIVDARSGRTATHRAGRRVLEALRPIEPYLADEGWTFDQLKADVTVVTLSPVDAAQATLGDLMLNDFRHYMATRFERGDNSPMLVIVDEFAQLVTTETDPADTAASLFETARSAGMGLILASQSAAGLSPDQTRRERALGGGAALIIGRSKDPEGVVRYAGTAMRMEASGAAAGDDLRSARAQHSYVIPPNDVREASDGSFWIIQGGAIAMCRALPPQRATPDPVATPAGTRPQSTTARVPDVPRTTAESIDPGAAAIDAALQPTATSAPGPTGRTDAADAETTPPPAVPRFQPVVAPQTRIRPIPAKKRP